MDIDFDELLADADVTPDLGSASRAQAEHAALLASLDRQARSRQLAVPTNELAVRSRLRELGEPQTLFGERPEDRRDRLRAVLSRLAEERGWDMESGSEESEEEDEAEEEFYTEGDEDLLEARRQIAEFSLARAKARVGRQKLEAGLPLSRIMAMRKAVYAELKVPSHPYLTGPSRLTVSIADVHEPRIASRRRKINIHGPVLAQFSVARDRFLDRRRETVERPVMHSVRSRWVQAFLPRSVAFLSFD